MHAHDHTMTKKGGQKPWLKNQKKAKKPRMGLSGLFHSLLTFHNLTKPVMSCKSNNSSY